MKIDRELLEEISNRDSFGCPEGEIDLDFEGRLLKYECWNRGCFAILPRIGGLPDGALRRLASLEGLDKKSVWIREMSSRGYSLSFFKHDDSLGELGLTYAVFERKGT